MIRRCFVWTCIIFGFITNTVPLFADSGTAGHQPTSWSTNTWHYPEESVPFAIGTDPATAVLEPLLIVPTGGYGTIFFQLHAPRHTGRNLSEMVIDLRDMPSEYTVSVFPVPGDGADNSLDAYAYEVGAPENGVLRIRLDGIDPVPPGDSRRFRLEITHADAGPQRDMRFRIRIHIRGDDRVDTLPPLQVYSETRYLAEQEQRYRPEGFHTMSVPALVQELWFSEVSLWWYFPAYRHVLVSLLDNDEKNERGTGTARWLLYVQGGPLIAFDEPLETTRGHISLGWTVSPETAQNVTREFFIPYLGFEIGALVSTESAGYTGSVVTGIHVFSFPGVGLSVGAGWTYSTTPGLTTVFRGGLALEIALGR